MITEQKLNVTIGRNVQNLRKENGWTTTEFAKKLKMSQAQVSRLENGRQGFRSIVLFRLANVLKVSVTEILKGLC